MPHRATGEAPGFNKGQESGARGEPEPETLLGFQGKVRQGRVNDLGLPSLNNASAFGLWGGP